LSTTLISFGFIQSKADYSLFIKQDCGKFTTAWVYVDDIVIAGSDQAGITETTVELPISHERFG